MGMAIVNGIIQSHVGYLDIQSQPGKGTAVVILLPESKEQPEPPVDELTAVPRGTERVLFVDDEPSITGMAEITLGQLGYTVTAFSDSLKALAAFENNPDDYDLVITDQTIAGADPQEWKIIN